jgi:hypothetical protein
MVKQISKQFVFTLGLMASVVFNVQAQDKNDSGVLTIDRMVVGASELNFPNDERIYPKVSYFEILNYVLMSSENGERWATITMKNLATGGRKFDSGQVMALFADGTRKKPAHKKRQFEAGETLSISLSFGVSKFPLLEVYTRQ